MLKDLCKKDAKWRHIAFCICKDEQLSDDLVQDMYLKLSECEKDVNDYYVVRTLRSLFLDLKRKCKTTDLTNICLKEEATAFEPDDYESYVLEEFNKLKWIEQELIIESYDKSYREIAKGLKGVGYNFVYNKTIGAIKKVLKEDFDLHKNSNLKKK